MSHGDHAHAHSGGGHGHDPDRGHGHGHEHAHGGHGEVLGHPLPEKFLVAILALLLFLTVVTVAVSYVDLGNANLFVAMLVASIKASVVALFFMHLRWDKPFNGLILVCAFFFLGIFIGFALLDTKEYQPEIVPMYELPGQMEQQLDTPPG